MKSDRAAVRFSTGIPAGVSLTAAAAPRVQELASGRPGALWRAMGLALTLTLAAALPGRAGVIQAAALSVLSSPTVSVTLLPSPAIGGEHVWGTITGASTNGFFVALVSDNAALAVVPASVAVPAGQQSASFVIETFPVVQPTTVNIAASTPDGTQVIPLTLQPARVSGIACSLPWIVGGTVETGLLHIEGPAPPEGALVALQVTAPPGSAPVALQVPAVVAVPPGQQDARFPIVTLPVTEGKVFVVSSPAGGLVGIQVLPYGLKAFMMQPPLVHPGDSVDGILVLDGPEPDEGPWFNLWNDQPDLLGVMSPITIPTGASAVTFSIRIPPFARPNTTINIFATYAAGPAKVVTLLVVAPGTPAAPTGLSATALSGTQVALTWTTKRLMHMDLDQTIKVAKAKSGRPKERLIQIPRL